MAHKGMREAKAMAKTLANRKEASSVSLPMFIFGSERVFLLAVACSEHYPTLCSVANSKTKYCRIEMRNCDRVLKKAKKQTGSFPILLSCAPWSTLPSPYFFFFSSSPLVSTGLLPRNSPTLDLVFFPQQKEKFLQRPQNLCSNKTFVPVDLMYWLTTSFLLLQII